MTVADFSANPSPYIKFHVARSRDFVACNTHPDAISDQVAFLEVSEGQRERTGANGRPEDVQRKIESFQEKPQGDGAWINAGYFVLEPSVIDYIDGDDTVFEQDPLRNLAHAGQLNAYKHSGFWQPMDTLRDKTYLEGLWEKGTAPWKTWE